MHHRVVEEHLQALRVRRRHERLQIVERAEARLVGERRGIVRRVELRPVAVVAGVPLVVATDAATGDGRIVERHRDPERVDAEIIEVARIDLLRDARPVAALVIGDCSAHAIHAARGVERRVAVEEAVDEDEVDDRVAPVEHAGRELTFLLAEGGLARLAGERVVRVVVGVGDRRLRRVDLPLAVDDELVLDGRRERDLDVGAPDVALPHHRLADLPCAGAAEVAAQLHGGLAAGGIRDRVLASLQLRGALDLAGALPVPVGIARAAARIERRRIGRLPIVTVLDVGASACGRRGGEHTGERGDGGEASCFFTKSRGEAREEGRHGILRAPSRARPSRERAVRVAQDGGRSRFVNSCLSYGCVSAPALPHSSPERRPVTSRRRNRPPRRRECRTAPPGHGAPSTRRRGAFA